MRLTFVGISVFVLLIYSTLISDSKCAAMQNAAITNQSNTTATGKIIDGKYCLESMISHMDSHCTGLVNISGTYTSRNRDGKVTTSDIDGLIQYDYPENKIRFDWAHPAITISDSKTEHKRTKFIRLNTKMYLYDGSVISTVDKTKSRVSPTYYPFDVRSMPFDDGLAFDSRSDWANTKKYISTGFNYIGNGTKNDLCELRLIDKNGGVESIMLFDVKSFPKLISHKRYYVNNSIKTLATSTEIHWQVYSNTYVLESITYDNMSIPGFYKSCTLNLNWKSFNSALDQRLYDYMSFQPKQGTVIFDKANNKSVLVGIVGANEIVGPNGPASNLPIIKQSFMSVGMVILLVTIICIAIISVIIVSRIRKTKSITNGLTSPLDRGAFTMIETLLVVGVLFILIALAIPAIQKVRASADAIECKNNLHQLGIALAMYHNDYGMLPPGCSNIKNDPYPFIGWSARLLPYLEQDALWQEAIKAYGVSKLFYNAPPHSVANRSVKVFICPADGRTNAPDPISKGYLHYLGVSGIDQGNTNGLLYLNSTVKYSMITDGLSNTVAVGERPPPLRGDLGWWYAGWGMSKNGSADLVLGVEEYNSYTTTYPVGPYHYQSGNLNNFGDTFHYWSFHPIGSNFLFADSSVRFIPYSAADMLPALSTRNGHEIIPDE